jgi:probable rRNA maturation factor
VIVLLASEHARGASASRRLRARARACLTALGREDAELSILLVTDRRIRTLNREWRGKDRATDVLSFPISEPPGPGSLLGDVVISLDTATRRARAEGRSIGAELDRYLAHGILHLLGYDHERPEDARRMAAKEAELARTEGLVGAALRKDRRDGRAGAAEERWTRSPTSISTPSRSGSTARGTRARTSRAGSRR